MQTLAITVHDVNEVCTIHVTTPLGHQHAFSGTIADGICTASYKPSYLLGVYHIYADVDGSPTETDTFTVAVDTAGTDLVVSNWQCDKSAYVPGQDLTFTFDLADSDATPLAGFARKAADTLYDSDSGRLSILRQIRSVDVDGTLTARIALYFDTTGRWSDIYAGTRAELSLYYKDGSALPPGWKATAAPCPIN